MKKSTRTIYGALLDSAKRFNDPLPILPNSTLNQKFTVFENELPRQNELPIAQYLAIGLKGSEVTLSTEGFFKTKYRRYNPRWASLLSHVPYIVRPVEQGLTSDQREKYRLRTLEEFNGNFYECWWLRKLDLKANPVGVEYRKLINGNISSVAWEPSLSDLNPTPLTVNPNQVLLTGDDYLAATKKFEIEFTPQDIQELLNVCNVMYGDPDIANITEFGLVSGIERVMQTNFNGIMANYTEAIYCQITDFINSTLSAPNALRGQKLFIDGGSNEPLIIVNNPITNG